MSTARRALVTGAGGFVGANLVRRLLADGHQVVALVRPESAPWRLTGVEREIEVRQVDLLDQAAVVGAVSGVRPDWVFHLAAHGAYSWQTDSSLIAHTNALATVSLVEACRDTGCEAFVHAGSSSEYGVKDHAPHEQEWLEPASAYAVFKACATHFCAHVARAGQLNAVTLRLYSVYGSYEEPKRLIPQLIVRGLKGELPPLVEPDTARDFVYAEDVVRAMVMAAEHPGHAPGAVYNIGSASQTTIRELVGLARETLGIHAEPHWGSAPARTWDTDTWVAARGRAQRELGWEPEVRLADGLEHTVAWLRGTREVWREYGLEA